MSIRELEESIRINGVLNPVIYEDGVLVDGHRRLRIAGKLGIHCPKEYRYPGAKNAKVVRE